MLLMNTRSLHSLGRRDVRRSDVPTFRRSDKFSQVSDQELEFAWLSRFQFGTVLIKVEHLEKTFSLAYSL